MALRIVLQTGLPHQHVLPTGHHQIVHPLQITCHLPDPVPLVQGTAGVLAEEEAEAGALVEAAAEVEEAEEDKLIFNRHI
jgi:hypothetical protein